MMKRSGVAFGFLTGETAGGTRSGIMAKPRVFVSSTYYDLKYVRSSLELFISSLGFDPVLFAHGGVAFAPDKALDESCYREVQNCDIYVLIIGGRYGSERTETKGDQRRVFYEAYESVTKAEYKSANEKDIQIYILIDKSVYAEYQTYLKNPQNTSITYAHVDHSGVFKLVEEVLSQRRNNPMSTFDRYSEIEEWLRSQWAGLYRDLLTRMHQQNQISTLAEQISTLAEKVNELSEVTKTLRRYLEGLIGKFDLGEGEKIIAEESKRLERIELMSRLKDNPLVMHIIDSDESLERFVALLRKAGSLQELKRDLEKLLKHPSDSDSNWLKLYIEINTLSILDYLNRARKTLGLKPYEPSEASNEEAQTAPEATSTSRRGKSRERNNPS